MGNAMGFACGVLGSVGIAEKRGQTSEKFVTGGKDPKSWRLSAEGGEVFAHDAPTCDPTVVGGEHGRHTRDGLHDPEAAFSAVLTAIPKVG